ncbi:AI-2E family transporter [Kribbella qitaiheensis]|uniref:AI-2E family transporter n=1 Tax=Kribbella qitaiheensis TaxID=1544730 RepID=A0A7G6X493_9ACTN|nr:AI-2E family transporter [Kribbella qitaiheensis]QNE21058.1 AI-2E family transporter [Kribbella qitaiheensis]
MELVPYLGPVLGAAPPVLVALLQGDPLTALWLVLLFIGLQQLEGHIVAPQVFGHRLRINPLLVMFALLLGGDLHGIPGALVALPIAAVARETVLYLRRHLLLEPWGTPSAAALTARPPQPTKPERTAAQRPRRGWALGLAQRWSTVRLRRSPGPQGPTRRKRQTSRIQPAPTLRSHPGTPTTPRLTVGSESERGGPH